ncbi:MAG: LLM class flavin-dependent oxidoreductase [Thermodesulfobacteriota bacterium]
MQERFTLSVVDQSPVRAGGTAADALWETVALAAAAEALGYRRFWVAEHHNLPGFAGTSPEILIGQIAARTHTIRVGSGGVMLTHYSALKVAEVFRVLESLYPGRVDLGIGRAPGSDPRTAAALAYPSPPKDVSAFPEQVDDLLAYLADALDPSHPFAGVRAGPDIGTVPEVWLLGSGIDSAALAARRGLPFSYAHFFGIGVEHGPAIVESYRRHFRPSAFLSEPKVNVAVQVLCAPTAEEARRLAASRDLVRLDIALGRRRGIPPVEEALAYPYSPEELAYLARFRRSDMDGDPRQVREQLARLAARYRTTDLSVVTICYDFAARVRSYALVAEACGITT